MVYVYVVTNIVPTMWLLIDGMQAFSKDGLVVLFYGSLRHGSYEFSEIFMCIIELELNSLVRGHLARSQMYPPSWSTSNKSIRSSKFKQGACSI